MLLLQASRLPLALRQLLPLLRQPTLPQRPLVTSSKLVKAWSNSAAVLAGAAAWANAAVGVLVGGAAFLQAVLQEDCLHSSSGSRCSSSWRSFSRRSSGSCRATVAEGVVAAVALQVLLAAPSCCLQSAACCGASACLLGCVGQRAAGRRGGWHVQGEAAACAGARRSSVCFRLSSLSR